MDVSSGNSTVVSQDVSTLSWDLSATSWEVARETRDILQSDQMALPAGQAMYRATTSLSWVNECTNRVETIESGHP